jgi:hypothetical protein
MACRCFSASFKLRLALLCLAAFTAFASPPGHAQAIDATNLRQPVEIGAAGVVQAGDNPAYAQPDFDDSKWLVVDAKRAPAEYFPQNQSPVLWRRLHVKVSSQQTDLALQAYFISRAFEVYVNGQKLIESGGVDPYVAYTRTARIIVPIPQGQLRTGSLVIAVRARAPLTFWSSPSPAFNGLMLSLGDESTLRQRNLLSMIGENSISVLENLLALGVGLVALQGKRI